MKNKERHYSSEKHHVSKWKKAIIILLFPIALITFAIFNGFFLDSLLQFIFEQTGIENTVSSDSGIGVVISGSFALVSGLVEFISIRCLLKIYDGKADRAKTLKWRLDKELIAMYVVGITSALVIITTRYDDTVALYLIIGLGMFPLMGIIATPNAVRYALHDMEQWENFFHKKGNLHNFKASKDFYRIRKRLPYERKIYLAVVKEQLLNLGVVVLVMILILGVYVISHYAPDSVTRGNIVDAVIYVKQSRSSGLLFFLMIFVVTFAIPIMAYYITNAVYKLRIVRHHKYIAYHAIVKEVDGSTIIINQDGRRFQYEYCSCVGIRAKDVHDTKATLIFIPDDMLLIPDEVEAER